MQRPVTAVPSQENAGLGEELGKATPVHLARGHREFAVLDRPEPADMAFDGYVVG